MKITEAELIELENRVLDPWQYAIENEESCYLPNWDHLVKTLRQLIAMARERNRNEA